MSRCPSLISSVQSPGSATLGNSATLQQGMAEGKHFFVEIASRITSDEPKIADFPGFALNTGDARSAEAKAFLATWQRSETFSCATWQWNFAMVDVFYEGWRSSFQWYVYSHLLSSRSGSSSLGWGVFPRVFCASLLEQKDQGGVSLEVCFWVCFGGLFSQVELPSVTWLSTQKMQTKIVPMDYKKYKL